VAGRFVAPPRGIILHGTRSGQPYDEAQEWRGTVNYVRNGAGGLGWNVTVGPDRLALHLEPDQYGWNARAASDDYLACEFAQAQRDAPISNASVDAFCYWVREIVLVRWPGLPLGTDRGLPTHAELERRGETGAIDGKSDVFSYGSPLADELRARIRQRLGV
jgi:hypothetical protein